MQGIDSDIYKKMENLKLILTEENKKLEKIKQTEIKDLVYLGSIDWSEIDHTGTKVKIKKDIYASIEIKEPNQEIIKYYDENNELIAINMKDLNQIIPTTRYIKDNDNGLYLKSQLKNLDFDNSISLNETNAELDKISKALNISKEQILSVGKSGYSNKENEKAESKEDDKIRLKDDKKAQKDVSKNENVTKNTKKNSNIKQETDLSQKINAKYTLGDILGIPSKGKLVAVYSSSVENNTNSTKFTFLIQDEAGNFLPCKNLEQVAGTTPKNDIYATNYDGSEVKKEPVNSMYRITSPHSNEGYVITADIGTMGTVDLGLGQEPKLQGINDSDTSLVTTPLKTASTYNTKPELKETFHSYKNSRYKPDSQVKEAKQHNDDCELTRDEVDGNENTGDQHLDRDKMLEIIDKIHLLEAKSDEYSSKETLLSDLISTYLSGNTHPSEKESLSACTRCENEHSRTHNKRQ